MNFRRILLTGAALGSAAALTAACSNSDDVVLTIPTTDSAVSGNDAGQRGDENKGGEDDGRFIARCSTEADGDGFAGQTFFTDGSSDFSDYCLQRFYSGVQPAPGAVYVPREDRENPSRESTQPTQGRSGEQSGGSESRPQQVPTDGQVLAEGQNSRNQNITEGTVGQQTQTEQGHSGVGAEQNRPDNFGAANAGSPNQPGNGNTGGNDHGGNNNTGGNQTGNNAGGNNTGGNNNADGGTPTTQPTTPTSPGQGGNNNEDNTTVPGLPGVTIPPLPNTPDTTQQQPSTPETTGGQQGGQTQTQTPTQTGQQQGGQTQTQTPTQTQSPQGTGSAEQQTPTQTQPQQPQGTVEDTSAPSSDSLGGLGVPEIPQFPQFPPLQVPDVGEVLNGVSS